MAHKDRRIGRSAKLSVNEDLLNRIIRHAHFLERHKSYLVNQAIGFLNTHVYPDILEQIEGRLAKIAGGGKISLTDKRLHDLQTSIRLISMPGFRQNSVEVRKDLLKLSHSEANWMMRQLKQVSPVVFELTLPDPKLITRVVDGNMIEGRFYRRWMSDTLPNELVSKIATQINIGITNGESVAGITRRIRGTRARGFADGVFGASRNNVQTIVRGSVQMVTAQARELTYAANSNVIKSVRWVSTLDTKTTPTCQSLDGEVFGIQDGPRPPIHHQCRSTTVPVTKSWKELGIDLDEAPMGTKPALNGRVPESTTYPEWLRSQPKSIQDEALGVGKAKLWREGKVDIKRFVDRKRAPLSLKEIERREGL